MNEQRTDKADLTAWDLSSADNPQPNVWPVCPTCSASWVWKKFMRWTGGYQWAWGKDCKHKAEPVLHTADGPYTPEARP